MTKFYLAARDNTTLLLTGAGIERTYEKFTAIKRWNDVGSWVLNLRAEDSHTALFLPDGSGNLHSGIIFSVDNEDGNGVQTVMTGPTTDVDVAYNEDNTHLVQVTGACDLYWLKHRISLPFAGWPYPTSVMGGAYNPTHYYQLAEASGVNAADSVASPQNGTYTGTVGYSQPGLIADPSTCITFDGTTTLVSVPVTGFLAGNNTFSVVGWGKFSANPAGNAVIWSHGSNVANENFWMGITSAGKPTAQFGNAATFTGTTALALGIPHCFEVAWDHTTNTATFVVDGNTIGSTGGLAALNIVYGVARIGAFVDNSAKWAGQIGHVAFFSNINIVTQYTDPHGIIPYTLWVYRVGLSELAYLDYAFDSGADSSNDLYNFISLNLNNPAVRMPFGFNAGSVPGLGTTSSGTYSRFDNLLTLAQYLALKSTPQLGFRLQQSGANLNLSIFKSRDQSATAVFSLARNNVRSYKWHYGVGNANYIYAGGKQQVSGVLESRVFAENSDATSISQFGRLEDFLDSRSAPDQATLQGAITAALAANKAQRSFQVTTKETSALYFMGPTANGYDVGDTVTTVLEGQTFVDVIREVSIDLQPNALPVVTPAIGTPTAAQVSSPVVTSTTNKLQANQDNISSQAINY